MNIAICDRYDTDITRISEFLDANIKKHMLNHALLEVDTFTSTDELLTSPKEYSLIFLGILMPGTDGIEAARQLKDGPNPPIIIFTTKSTEHCLASYNPGQNLKPNQNLNNNKNTTKNININKSTNGKASNKAAARTGDQSPVWMYTLLSLAALAVIAAVICKRRFRR